MPALYPEYWPQFFTAAILEWKPLLQQDKYKDEIVKSPTGADMQNSYVVWRICAIEYFTNLSSQLYNLKKS